MIWPENSSDIDPYRNADAFDGIGRAAKAVGVPILVGAVVGGDTAEPRNTAILWDPQRGPIGEYTKRTLQPFGETMRRGGPRPATPTRHGLTCSAACCWWPVWSASSTA